MSKNTIVLEKLKELCLLHKESVNLLGRCACYLTLFIMGKEFLCTNVNQQLRAHYEIAEEYNYFICKCSDFLADNNGCSITDEAFMKNDPLLCEATQLITRFQELIRKNKVVLDEVEQISRSAQNLPLQIN